MIEGGRGSVNTEWLTNDRQRRPPLPPNRREMMYHIVIYSCYLEIQRDFAIDIYMQLVQVVWIQIEAILLPLLLNCLLLRIIFEQSSVIYKTRNCEKEKHVFVILKGCIIQQ